VVEQGQEGGSEQRNVALFQKDIKILLRPEVNTQYSGQRQRRIITLVLVKGGI
jgi:hypothetical protein